MEPQEIFELIVKADEKLKYATAGKQDFAGSRPGTCSWRAREAAAEIGNHALVQQADTRLAGSWADRRQRPGRQS